MAILELVNHIIHSLPVCTRPESIQKYAPMRSLDTTSLRREPAGISTMDPIIVDSSKTGCIHAIMALYWKTSNR